MVYKNGSFNCRLSEDKKMDSRITIDPNICHGKPVIKNTRVLVSNILGDLAIEKREQARKN
jgi:uncharacterized protein (DUF433 family)